MNTTKEQFFDRFVFDKTKIGYVGIEREQFLLNSAHRISPLVPDYLGHIRSLNGKANFDRFCLGYELSACQLESKIGPCRLDEARSLLTKCDETLDEIDKKLGVSRLNLEFAPVDMPLDVYPDPTGRYQIMVQNMPIEKLRAACRVAATHIHIGMADMRMAIKAYNRAIRYTDRLIKIGDFSFGERMKLYPIMAPRYMPEPILSPDDFFEQAVRHGFVQDPRACWTLIRISIHGTLEFRMFGAVDSIDQIVMWARRCHSLCF